MLNSRDTRRPISGPRARTSRRGLEPSYEAVPVHQTIRHGKSGVGRRIRLSTGSRAFTEAVEALGADRGDKTPPNLPRDQNGNGPEGGGATRPGAFPAGHQRAVRQPIYSGRCEDPDTVHRSLGRAWRVKGRASAAPLRGKSRPAIRHIRFAKSRIRDQAIEVSLTGET